MSTPTQASGELSTSRQGSSSTPRSEVSRPGFVTLVQSVLSRPLTP
jgi:hypothetical protein